MKRNLVVCSILVTLVLAFTACGGKEETPADAAQGAVNESSDAGSADVVELKEVTVEEVGTFYLPEEFTLEESGISEEGLPRGYASFVKDGMYVDGSRFGKDAYDAAGLSIPESLEEYSQRDGVKNGLPEGTEFKTDSYGNLYAEYTVDGRYCYQVLKMGEESCGAVIFTCDENEKEAAKELDFALWLSKMQLK